MGFKKYLFKTYEKMMITKSTTRAVLIIKFSLSSICEIILSAFSDIRIKPLLFKLLIILILKIKNCPWICFKFVKDFSDPDK